MSVVIVYIKEYKKPKKSGSAIGLVYSRTTMYKKYKNYVIIYSLVGLSLLS